ncbi:MutS-related protein [Pedobacter insulae]|uniref:MutS domain III n=1 Tax=Pedobacter insulae TaxID=414048 RepID=A0A1I2XYH4_9SPHI|nr:hypothetical protein [Pedobacter insulae]SFH18513.1 MutS domain III [Pedobacter insulae]
MDFKMDEQTYGDLNVFGGSENNFSLFALFKKTKTVGGRALMEHWMRNPSNSIEELQKRTAAINYFSSSVNELLIDHDQFDLILHYVNYDRGFLRSNILDSFFPWLSNRIKANQNYYVVQVGIKHLLVLLKYADELSSQFIDLHAPARLQELAIKIHTILEKPGIRYATSLSHKTQFSFRQLGKLDTLIRRENRLTVLELLALFYELDVFEGLAKVAKERAFCIPTYLEDGPISIAISGLFHPALAEPIKNDLKIDHQNNLIFLSGSNMAGKSSLLKSIGIAVYLAHLGFPVPAASMQTVVFNGLITTINLADMIESGLSHYYSEVMRVKKIALLLTERKRMFIILDELFKGTNAQDAFDASLLVVNGLAVIPNSIFIVSSHITALADELKAKNIAFKYLEHLIVDEKPKFTYQLKTGVSTNGIGMYFIERENILGLLAEARN